MEETRYAVRPDERSAVHEGIEERRLLFSSMTVLDRFLGGFEGSKVALLDGDDGFVFEFAYALCARAVLDLDTCVVYVDGGNQVNPRAISSVCRRFGADRGLVLPRVSIARAFTAYQMAAIIEEGLERAVDGTGAGALVVSCLPALFYDVDLGSFESGTIYRRCLDKVRALTAARGLVTIMTDYERRAARMRHGLKRALYESADRVVRFERGEPLRVWDVNCHSFVDFSPAPPNQAVLEHFMGDDGDGQDCADL